MKYKTLLNTRVINSFQNDHITVVKCLSGINLEKLPIDKNTIQIILWKYFPNISLDGFFTTVGKTKLHKEDKFDSNKGYYIAESKAQEKAYLIASRVYEKIYERIRNTSNEILNLCENTKKCQKHCSDHIKELEK